MQQDSILGLRELGLSSRPSPIFSGWLYEAQGFLMFFYFKQMFFWRANEKRKEIKRTRRNKKHFFQEIVVFRTFLLEDIWSIAAESEECTWKSCGLTWRQAKCKWTCIVPRFEAFFLQNSYFLGEALAN